MINTLLFFAFGKEVAKIVKFFGLLTFALKKSIFVFEEPLIINLKNQTSMSKTLSKEVPENYVLCLHEDCPCASTCLRHLACKPMMERSTYLRVLNPDRCVPGTSCRYYRDSAPVVYARGFKGMQARMLPAQYQKFRALLLNHFSQNTFYERRRGDFALSPEEQKMVLQALHQAGVTEDLSFDRYEESICW